MGGRGANSGKEKSYIRFGKVPQNGKSINWLSLSLDDSEAVSFELKNGGENLQNMLKPEHYEKGVSVFEIDKNGLPKLDNLQLISTLSIMLARNTEAYTVKGKEATRGNDGEPVINSVKNVTGLMIDSERYSKHIIKTLHDNFKNHSGLDNGSKEPLQMFNVDGELRVTYRGITFTSPRKGFKTSLGYTGKQKSTKIRHQEFAESTMPLSDYLKKEKISTKKYVSKKGKNMISYEKDGRTFQFTESDFKNKTITDYIEKWI